MVLKEKPTFYLTKYLSTAPVIGTIWMVFTAGILIEINRFFPDGLYLSF
nr:photosystem I subunit IX [Goniotrichopsis reniformis]UNJ14714.1 photosystem I subunit IX [Goniotrichopsis reniformis]